MKKAGELNMCIKRIIFVSLAGLMLSACESDTTTTLQDSLTADNTISDKDAISNYDLAEGVIPFPNDFLFAPNEDVPVSDGTINIPVEDITDLSDPQVAINGLDGFSTVAPITTGFNTAVDETSISGQSVRVYPITKGFGPGGPATAVDMPLVFGVDYVAALSSVDPTNSTLAILPLKPLAPKSSYAVVITNKLRTTSGSPFGVSASYALTRATTELYDLTVPPAIPPSTAEDIVNAIKNVALLPDEGATDEEIVEAGVSAATLETIRSNIVKPTEDAILAADSSVISADIILQWTFTTQSTTDVMAATRAMVKGLTASAVVSPEVAFPTQPSGAGDVHFGSLDVPYFLEASVPGTPDSPSFDPTALFSCWEGAGAGGLGNCAAGPHVTQFNSVPTIKSTETIPLILTTPKVDAVNGPCFSKPAEGWPVVIFQHGITRNRGHVLGVADSISQACMAAVAIDIPMHGVAGNETDGTAGLLTDFERHFYLDLVAQGPEGNIIAPGPDGQVDFLGAHFVNLSNLLNARDNLRQSVSDLFVLVDAIEEGAVTDGANPLDASRIYYYGFSLGGIAGTVFIAMEPAVRDAVLVFSSVGVAKTLDGSFNFGPALHAGLAAKGVVKGTPDYEAFLGAAQTVLDSSDSVNFSTLATQGRGILFMELVGGNSSPSDLSVPNTVPDANDTTGTVPAPLAGSEAQIALMGLTHVNTDQGPGGDDLKVVTKYISGEHGSLIDPTVDLAVTTELQSQAATFFASDGVFLDVTNDSVLQAPAP